MKTVVKYIKAVGKHLDSEFRDLGLKDSVIVILKELRTWLILILGSIAVAGVIGYIAGAIVGGKDFYETTNSAQWHLYRHMVQVDTQQLLEKKVNTWAWTGSCMSMSIVTLLWLIGITTMLMKKKTRVIPKMSVAMIKASSLLAAEEQAVIDKYCVNPGIRAVDDAGLTILHRAVRDNMSVEYIKYLVAMGADVNAKALGAIYVTQTQPILPFSQGDQFVSKRGFGSGLTSLDLAIDSANIETIKFIISSGASVNTEGEYHTRPLSRAVRKGNIEVIKCLVSSGADVNAKTHDTTPLDMAKRIGDTAIIKYLSGLSAHVDPLIAEICQNEHLYHGVEFRKKDGRFNQNRLEVRRATGNYSWNFTSVPPVKLGSDEESAISDVSKQYGNNIAYMVAAVAKGLNGQANSTSSSCGGIYAPKGKEQEVFVSLLNQGFRIFVPIEEFDLIESQVKWCRCLSNIYEMRLSPGNFMPVLWANNKASMLICSMFGT